MASRCLHLELPVNSIDPNSKLAYSHTCSHSVSFPHFNKLKRIPFSTRFNPSLPSATTQRGIRQHRLAVRSTSSAQREDDSETQNDSTEAEIETATSDQQASDSTGGGREVELSDLGKEIKKIIKEREDKEEEGINQFLSGVSEEIQEIEWPAFAKVVRTTGVVLGVIAGSSVVLLTVNAVLAELSDRVFAGKGVQDFFG